MYTTTSVTGLYHDGHSLLSMFLRQEYRSRLKMKSVVRYTNRSGHIGKLYIIRKMNIQ